MTGNTLARQAGSTSRRAPLLILALGLVLITVFSASAASAHRGEQSYLYLDVTETELGGSVHLPYTDIREVLGLSLEGTDEEIQAELAANRDELINYIKTHTSIGADGVEWALEFSDEDPGLLDEGEGAPGYALFPYVADLPVSEVPRELDVTFDPFLSELDGRDSIVLVGNDWQRGVFDQEANELRVFTPGDASATIDLGNPSQWLNFTGSIGLGVDHIQDGPDHVFFVLVLLIPSVLVFAGTWKPAPSFISSLWRILKIVTMFTLAHSITFTLAGLDFIPLPSAKIVETVIAVSIAAAAIHNLRPVFLNREWLLAFGFGLFHGLGFASLVEELDTDRGTQLISLLGRNIGIEIGQAVVVLVAFPALFLLRRTRYYNPLMIVGSIGLAIIAIIWAIERIFEVEFGTTDFILLFTKWPRSFIAMIFVTVAAWLIHRTEDRAGRLLPVGPHMNEIDQDEARKQLANR
ncbi:MAG: HupE/UreJ family protein [Actinomycetota bacterium]